MTPLRRPLLSVLAVACALLAASAAQAQVVRPSQSVYVLLRGAVAGYSGDLDRDPGDSALDITDGFADPGFGVGGEIGYLFSETLSFGLGFMYQDFPTLEGTFGPTTNTEGGEAYQFQGLFRYLPFSGARVSPFLELGGALVAGQGTEDERNNGAADDDVWGYGPVVGLGLDVVLTPRLGLFLGAQSTLVFPDVALDGADPSAFGNADNEAFDVITNLGGGLRFAFRSPVAAPEILSLQCPGELETGETGSFTVVADGDAGTTNWSWGDGTTGSGANAIHLYSAPGTYTVTATTTNAGGSDTESCLVTVVDPGEPPTLAGCRATPSIVGVGESVTVNATASEAEDVEVDFGDGSSASALPASYSYSNAGTYQVTISAFNAYGEDSCTVTVTVGDTYCQSVAELNPVFFGYGATTLTPDAQGRLDENIEILRRCPDICVLIEGYSDGVEPGDPLRVSQARANAVMEYYAARGIDMSRLRAVGRGVDPQANPKEDPSPGATLGRRADSIPSNCNGF